MFQYNNWVQIAELNGRPNLRCWESKLDFSIYTQSVFFFFFFTAHMFRWKFSFKLKISTRTYKANTHFSLKESTQSCGFIWALTLRVCLVGVKNEKKENGGRISEEIMISIHFINKRNKFCFLSFFSYKTSREKRISFLPISLA